MSDHQNKPVHTLLSTIPNINQQDLQEVEARLKEAKVKATEFIRAYPLTSVAIGIGIGYLVGKMFSKK